MFELNVRYTFVIDNNSISSSGIQAIQDYIRQQEMSSAEWQVLNPDCKVGVLTVLPTDWRWQWLVTDKTAGFVGTFPKRVRAYYYKTFQIKCPESFVAEIGNLARQHTGNGEQYTFDMVSRFDWNAGDFGDRGSCYWGSNWSARDMLSENNGRAIRFFDESGKGYGRAWFVEIDINLYIVWNGYGMKGDSTLKIARIFSLYLKLEYKEISLTNNYGSTLYINGERGFVVGNADAIESIDEYDFDWYDPEIERCYNCGEAIHHDDVYYGADDMPYCESCYDSLFTSCDECGNAHSQYDVRWIESTSTYVCDWCYNRKYTHCPRCNEDFRKRDMVTIGTQQFCQNCTTELNMLGDNIE